MSHLIKYLRFSLLRSSTAWETNAPITVSQLLLVLERDLIRSA